MKKVDCSWDDYANSNPFTDVWEAIGETVKQRGEPTGLNASRETYEYIKCHPDFLDYHRTGSLRRKEVIAHWLDLDEVDRLKLREMEFGVLTFTWGRRNPLRLDLRVINRGE